MRSIALALLALAACSRPAPRAPAPVTTDDLWRLAPTGSQFSLVATGPAIATALATARVFAADLRRLPHPQASEQLAAMLQLDGIDFLADGGPPGLDPTRGIAMFGFGRDLVVVYPARDPAAFAKVARPGRVCRPHGAYAACAATAAHLDRLGSGGAAAAQAAAARPAHLRGAVELVEAGDTPVTAVVDVERGVAELRAHIGLSAVASSIPAVTPSPLAERVRTAPASGAFLIDLRPFLPQLTAAAGPRAAAFSMLRGDVAAVALAGATPRSWVAIGIANPAAIQQLIDGCGALSSPGLELRPQGGRCLITPKVAGAALPSLEARLDGDVVVIETPGALAARGTPAPEVTALLEAPAFLATWGGGVAWRPALAATASTGQRPELEWLADRIDEMGLIVRPERDGVAITARIGSVYRNPDPVLARLDAVLALGQPADAVTAGLATLAREHPQSPLARAVALGPTGTMLPFGTLIVVALFGVGALR